MNHWDQISEDGHIDFPEAETMETRRKQKMSTFEYGVFWGALVTAILLMFLGNYIVSVISQ